MTAPITPAVSNTNPWLALSWLTSMCREPTSPRSSPDADDELDRGVGPCPGCSEAASGAPGSRRSRTCRQPQDRRAVGRITPSSPMMGRCRGRCRRCPCGSTPGSCRRAVPGTHGDDVADSSRARRSRARRSEPRAPCRSPPRDRWGCRSHEVQERAQRADRGSHGLCPGTGSTHVHYRGSPSGGSDLTRPRVMPRSSPKRSESPAADEPAPVAECSIWGPAGFDGRAARPTTRQR